MVYSLTDAGQAALSHDSPQLWATGLAPLWRMWDSDGRAPGSHRAAPRGPTEDDPPLVTFILMDAQEGIRIAEAVTRSLQLLQKVNRGALWGGGIPSGPEGNPQGGEECPDPIGVQ